MSELPITRRSVLAMPLALQLGAMTGWGVFTASGATTAPSLLRIGAIGIDSSHLPNFARRINAANDAGETRCRVTHLWHDEQPDTSEQRWRNFHQQTLALGVQEAPTLQELLDQVDAAMITAVNGNKHRTFATAALERGKPLYIDKPLACSVDDALAILELSRRSGVPCYSASSLRCASEIETLERQRLSRLVALDAFGPGSRHEKMPGLFYYGVHTIELVDAIWGPGVSRVRAVTSEQRDIVDLEYADGRYARLRLDREAASAYGATVHGEKGVQQFTVNAGRIYPGFIEKMIRFFETGHPPVPLRDIVENVAVMQAGNESMSHDGRWVQVPTIA